jgi:hypothetical protein
MENNSLEKKMNNYIGIHHNTGCSCYSFGVKLKDFGYNVALFFTLYMPLPMECCCLLIAAVIAIKMV